MGTGPETSRAGRPRQPIAQAERGLYAAYAGVLTLWAACLFYASMRQQVLYTSHLPLASANDWSAPLDDVFIHFDFARAIARGHPFQWSEGNGYSSGGTSVLYPFVLAFGYWVGFRKLTLMVWAALVACVSTYALLLASRRLFRDLPRWTSYILPASLLGVGVLDWTLFSGMEVAFFLAVWAGALIAWDDLTRGTPDGAAPTRPLRWALWLGAWGALLVATRPEAAVVVGVLGLSAALGFARRQNLRSGLAIGACALVPALAVLALQAVLNRVFTGEATAAGALVKLEAHHPYLDAQKVWDAWKFHVEYQVRRVAEYHLSDVMPYGYIPFALAVIALFLRETRRYAAVLVASAVLWVLVVALNGQVRWQNERYTMPALAWLLSAAALGAGGLLGKSWALGRRGLTLRAVSSAVAVLAMALFAWHQKPRFNDQVWFFGRASRNIRDQHVRVGRLLRDIQPAPPRRVLLGDAGAIPYASDLPALDIIGLGGYHGLPFARATRQSIGAAVELIEHIPRDDRPDLLAIYPSWWGVFPLWFGEELGEVPVSGNVICGGAAKVLYRAEWGSLEGSGVPAVLAASERVVDELDPADLVSEKNHGYATSVGIPYVEMKLLADPLLGGRDLFDAGRILPEGASQWFELDGIDASKPAKLVFRLAPPKPGTLKVKVDGREVGELSFEREETWVEPKLELAAGTLGRKSKVTLEAAKGESIVHHLWVVQQR